MKNILAMDLGKTTLGLAISRSGILVTPLTNIKFPAEDYDECIQPNPKCKHNYCRT